MRPFLRSSRMRLVARRLALALGAALALSLGAAAAPAGAVVAGEFGVQRREAVTTNPTIPLQYHGGPVAQVTDTYPIYWDPTGAYRPDWMTLIDRYLYDVGASSGQLSNVFSLDSQYTDSEGQRASYQSTLRGPYTDTDAYPANGCTEPEGEPVCLSDAQIRAELKAFIEANHLPTGVDVVYFVLTPPGVTVCTDSGGKGNCSDSTATGSEPPNGICGYHAAIEPSSTSPIVYGVQPWVAGDAGRILKELPLKTAGSTPAVNACQNGAALDEPNQTGARSPFDDYETGLADVIINDLSIEQNDIVVDPLLNGWYQEGTDAEQSDMCQRAFSPAPEELPKTPETTHALNLTNESINGHSYYLQWAFSSVGVTSGKGVVCWEGTELRPHFTPPNPVNAGDIVGFDANESSFALDANTKNLPPDEPFTAPVYKWNFGDGTVVSGANDASEYHSYQYGGTYKVTLTVTDSGGNSASVTNPVTVTGPLAPGSGGGSGTSSQSGSGSSSSSGGSSAGHVSSPVATQAVLSRSLARTLRGGLVVSYSVNEQVTGHFEVLLAASIAHRIGLRDPRATGLPTGTPAQVVVAKAILVTTRGGRSTIKIQFGKSTAARLRRLGRVQLLLRLVLHNSSGGFTTVLSKITLGR